MAVPSGEIYVKLFVPEVGRDRLIDRLRQAGAEAWATPGHVDGGWYVEATAAQSRIDALRKAADVCGIPGDLIG